MTSGRSKSRIEVLDRVVVAGGGQPHSRALAGVQLLGNGDLLVGYRDASVHPVGDHKMIDDGAVMTVRSTDGGRTWEEPQQVIAVPGWDCAGGRSMVQTPDGGGATWELAARLYEAADWNCGYPGLVLLPGGDMLCIYYTSYEAGNCEVHGVFLRERT